jgi:predicted deacylase
MAKNKEFKLLGETILAGESKTIEVDIAKLQTMTKLKIPVIIERSKTAGPVVLFTAAIHGDEINGTEIVRKIITSKLNKPKCGTIICIPVVNIFGFINQKREFPDNRDLNRVFPGSKNGSLASRFAYFLVNEIIPNVDYVIDFHAGGASRFNAPQIRIIQNNVELKELATIFNAPFTLYSSNIAGSFRNMCFKNGVKILLFEGGKSLDINDFVTNVGLNGVKRFLNYLRMLPPKIAIENNETKTIFIEKSTWIRANNSGMFHGLVTIGSFVKKGTILAIISDPFGKKEYKLKATTDGFIINVNDAPIVYQGDAVFHITTKLENE